MIIPKAYSKATWRNTTRVCGNPAEIGVGFDYSNGEVIRLRIDIEDARILKKSIEEHLHLHDLSHSDKSSGIPRELGSIPLDGQVV